MNVSGLKEEFSGYLGVSSEKEMSQVKASAAVLIPLCRCFRTAGMSSILVQSAAK